MLPILFATLAVAPPPASTTLDAHTFAVAEGYEIRRATTPGLVSRPVTAAFDDRGRLYVTTASGTNEPVADQLKKKPHQIVRLEDTDGDGVFDKSVVFADGLMLPEGCMFLAGSLYVACPPSIVKLTDTDGDGRADRREEWFAGKTLTGCANDLHGPYAGPDGMVYWTKGAFAEQKYRLPDGRPFATRAAHLFRARPDGTRLEPVMTGGMDNPVGVAFSPGGDRVFSTTFFQHPAGGRRDGLVHAIPGALYGKDHAALYSPPHPQTHPDLMPPMTHLGPAAPAGMCATGDTILVAQFNMAKVSRHVLKQSGSTFVTEDGDFVVSDNRDFHPTDVVADADGSYLVIDTGGWYKLCCPSSQLVKNDVLGGIYRVRRKGTAKIDDPRGENVPWTKIDRRLLVRLLDDDRPVVRDRAVDTLARRKAVAELAAALKSGNARTRLHAVRSLTRIDDESARAATRPVLADADFDVRQSALNAVSLHRDAGAVKALIDTLRHPSAHSRRVAAEALGRIRDKSAVAALAAASGKAADRGEHHSIVLALIEIADVGAMEKQLAAAESPGVTRGVLVVLENAAPDRLTAERVTPLLRSPDAELRRAARWVASRHPEWGDSLAAYFGGLLRTPPAADDGRAELAAEVARFGASAAVRKLLAGRLADEASTDAERGVVLRAMAAISPKDVPAEWAAALLPRLSRPDALATARALYEGKPAPEALRKRLSAIAEESSSTATLLAAAACLAGGTMADGVFSRAVASLDAARPVAERGLAADALARSRLTQTQRAKLAGVVAKVGAMEIERICDAIAAGKDDDAAATMLRQLLVSPVRDNVRIDAMKVRVKGASPRVQSELTKLVAALDADAAGRGAELDKLLASLPAGDVRRGQAVFNSAKAGCLACHAVGYVGGRIGPDLTNVGRVRSRRDLLEAVVYPSASLVRSYETVVVETKRGKSFTGIVRRETADEIVLTLGADQEVSVRRAGVESQRPGKVSIMPSGIDKILSPTELADLVAFLMSRR